MIKEIKERDCSSTASLITWCNLLLTVKWTVNQGTTVNAVSVIVQLTVIRTQLCVYLFVCAKGRELLDVPVSVRAVSLVLISAKGFKASNTSSWLGTSDILFTSLLLWTTYPLWGETKNINQMEHYFFEFLRYSFEVYCSCCFDRDKCCCWTLYIHCMYW